MATKLISTVLKCTPNLRHHGNQPSSRELNLPGLCADALAAWATDHPADLSYRVELARRIALTFDDADQLIIMDDVALVVPQSERAQFHGMRGCDRSLLPALWLATGFRAGAKLLVYAPPNPVEMKTYLKLKKLIEDRLQRVIPIGIFYEDEQGDLQELIELFEKDSARYTSLCEQFAQRPIDAFYPEYHVQLLKRYVEKFTKDIRCSFVFPYEMTEYHRQELASYSDRLKLPDLPISDKAKHNLFLKSKGFPSLPKLVAVAASGKLIDTYAEYLHAIENSDEIDTENTDENIVKFAGGVIEAVNLLFHQHRVSAFVKLDASGAAGWSCMSPAAHPILYNCQEDGEKRLKYLCDYMRSKVVGNRLPTLAVVEEFIQAEKRPGNIDADYTVCGFVLNGKFFPTSINLCGTINGSYIEQWTSSTPIDLNDSPTYWQRMFQTYSMMVNLEAQEFGYYNGVYAGDLFVTREGQHKQRDWNIRRGGRSSPEALTLFGMPNYETKVTISMADLHLNQSFTNLQLFHLYTDVCQSLLDDYGMYVFSSAFGYCGKDDRKNDYLKFNVLVHPKWLVNIGKSGEKISVPRYEHRAKVQQIVRDTTAKILQRRQC